MPFIKLEYIYKLIEEKELPYFKVTDGKTLIGKNNEVSEPTKARELLEEILEMIQDSVVCISLSDRSDKERSKGGSNWDNYTFKVRLNQSESIAGTGGINGTILSLMNSNNELARKFEMLQKEHELNGLKKEIEELKQAKEKPDALEKYAPLLYSALTGHPLPMAVAGVEDGAVDETVVEKQAKAREAIARLTRIDKNFHNTLLLLAEFAEKHPEKYHAFLPMLKAQI